jgi:hypothetical protein
MREGNRLLGTGLYIVKGHPSSQIVFLKIFIKEKQYGMGL